jgi:microcystin-dependent protein
MNGLNNINANSIDTQNLDVQTLQIEVSGTVPTRITGDNTINIANTAFVQTAVSNASSNLLSSNNTWTGTNSFNSNLPTSTLTPTTSTQLTTKTYVDNNFVSLSGNQTLTTGIKTFTNLPECSAVPVSNNQLVNKQYVDNGAFVNLTGNQTISGQKTFNNFNYITNDNATSEYGTLIFQDSTGAGASMYYNNDDSSGFGGLRVVSTSYGFAFSSTTGAGEHCDFISQDINFRSTDKCDFTEFVIPPPAGGQLVRGSIYDNTTDRVTFTFSNGQATDIGVTFNALNVIVPAGNRCNMVRVSIPFDLLAWATFGLPAGSGTVGLRFDSFSVVYLRNGSPFTPFRSESTSSAIGVTRNWTKTGTQSNIQGISSYFGNLDIAFGIAINNTSTDTYQVRVNPQATITFSAFSFDGFKFVCRNATGGQTNGNGFTTTSITSFTGGTLVYGGGNPAFVDTTITQLSQSYPVPPVSASCFMPLNNNITPPGMISQYAGSTAPQGWLLCNGGSYSITTYPNLYSVISNIYGGSLGAGTFSVPDTRGLFVSSAGSQTLNSITYTRTLGEKQNHQLQDHKHTYSDMIWWDTDTGGGSGQTIFVAGADFQVPGGDNNGSNGDGNFSNRLTKATWPSTAVNPGAPIQQWNTPTNVSAITGTDTYPANIAFNYIIKW